MTDLSAFAELVPLDHGLCVVSTLRADGSIQSTLVNAGVLDHPLTGEPVVGLVAAGAARELRNLRADPRLTVVARAAWRWAAVDGRARLIGPDDPHAAVDAERLRLLLRDIFTAAAGNHEDWETYDRVTVSERRTAVLVVPQRAYSNPG